MAGLTPNPAKSATIEIWVDGKRKKAVTGMDSIVKLDNHDVVALVSSAAYKYLGIGMTASGTVLKVSVKLSQGLETLTKAPLQPQQRMFMLRVHFLLQLYHELVLGGI